MDILTVKTLGILLAFMLMSAVQSASGIVQPCKITGNAPYFNVRCYILHGHGLPSDLPQNIFILQVHCAVPIHIPKTLFQGRNISTLQLSNCGLNDSFVLPSDLLNLKLNNNALSNENLKEMFTPPQEQLLTLDISGNRINVEEFLNVLQHSPSLIAFIASENTWPALTRENIKYFRQLRTLEASNVNMAVISSDALAGMSNLADLNLANNQIKIMPDAIFHDCKELKYVNLYNNNLTYLPKLNGLSAGMETLNFGRNGIQFLDNLTDSGIKFVNHLNFHGNKIKYIPKDLFKRLHVSMTLDLSMNEISRLDSFIFGNITRIAYLLLQQNNITYISRDAFQGIKNIDIGLFLFMNKMTRLPNGLFRGMKIKKIFIHSNMISYVDNSFQGIDVTPEVLVVYDNRLEHITSSFVSGITPATHIYVSCNQLQNLNLKDLRGIGLLCSPQIPYQVGHLSKWLVISLRDGGFFCSKGRGRDNYTCEPCPTGQYNNGGHRCTRCPQGGYYQDNVGQAGCKPCPVGQFVNFTGGNSPLACNTCPIGANTTRYATTRACFCLNGFARRNRFEYCERCKAYGVTCQRDFEELIPGHWWMFPTKERKEKYACFTDGLLKYDVTYNFSCTYYYQDKPKAYKCPVQDACLGGVRGECSKNYTGVLCDVCSTHYYRHLKSCVGCPGRVWAITQMVIVLILFVLLCLLLEWADRKHPSDNNRRTLADVILSSLKIVLGFYQTLSVTLILLADIPWPKSLVYVSHYFRYFEMRVLSVRSLRCIFPGLRLTLIDELLISLGATVGVPIAIVVIMRLCICFIPRRIESYDRKINQIKKVCYRYIAIFLFATFTMTSRRVFQMLPMGCITLCHDREMTSCIDFVRADVRLKCAKSEPDNWIYVYLAYAGLAVPIGFPLVMLVLVKIYKKYPQENEPVPPYQGEDGVQYYPLSDGEMEDDDRMHLVEGNQALNEDDIDDKAEVVNEYSPVEFAIKFLYENYKSSAWYWELIEIFRKLSVILALAVFGADTRTNLGMFITLSGFFAILYSYYQPIKDKNEHVLQMISLTVLFLNSCAGLLLKVSPRDTASYDDRRDNLGISIILVFLNGFILLIIFVRLLKGLGGACLKCIRARRVRFVYVKDFVKSFKIIKDVK